MMEKLAQSSEGVGGARPPNSLYLPSRTKLQCTLQLRGQIHSPYFVSIPICILCYTQSIHFACGFPMNDRRTARLSFSWLLQYLMVPVRLFPALFFLSYNLQILGGFLTNWQYIIIYNNYTDFFILDPWSWIWIFFIPDPGSRIRIKEFKYFNQKNSFSTLRNMIRVFHPGSDPDPDPGSGSWLCTYPRSRIPDPDSQHWRFRVCSGCRG